MGRIAHFGQFAYFLGVAVRRSLSTFFVLLALSLFATACTAEENDAGSASPAVAVTTVVSGTWDENGQPVDGGPVALDGSRNNNLTQDFCAHNRSPSCPMGGFVGPFTQVHPHHGRWDADGLPVAGGPTGADRSTGNDLTWEYCARNDDPRCPADSYVDDDAVRDPSGGPGYVTCEKNVCTTPNLGSGSDRPGMWDAAGSPVDGGPIGADGALAPGLTAEYCFTNEDPSCPLAIGG